VCSWAPDRFAEARTLCAVLCEAPWGEWVGQSGCAAAPAADTAMGAGTDRMPVLTGICIGATTMCLLIGMGMVAAWATCSCNPTTS
jgi:hypothetical protein